PARPPPVGGDAAKEPGERWLEWTTQNLKERQDQPETLCHLFTERPIYRPEEPVHIKAWVRTRKGGDFAPFRGKAQLVVTGEDNGEWRYPATFTPEGTFYKKFDEKTDATGDYEAHLEFGEDKQCGTVAFK